MIEMISNSDAGEALRKMHPQSPAFESLRQAFLQMRQEIFSPTPPDPATIQRQGQSSK